MNTPQNSAPRQFAMTAPTSTSGSERKEHYEIMLIAPGNHLGRLYGIIDLGTQLNAKFNKKSRKIALLFEFPHLMQSYYKDEEKIQPAMIKMEETFSMHPKSNFRRIMENGLGKKFTDDEAANFDVANLLGQWFTINVHHEPSKKEQGRFYERISFLQPYDERFRVDGVNYNGINPLVCYYIDFHKFAGEEWRKLWGRLRDKIKQSEEGQRHASMGGTFEEVTYDDNGNPVASTPQGHNPSYQGPQAPTGMMGGPAAPQQSAGSPQNFSPVQGQYQQPVGGQPAQGYGNVQQMQQNVQQQNAVQQSPATGQAAPQRTFKILKEPFDLSVWKAKGWTEDLMVQKGYGQWVEGA